MRSQRYFRVHTRKCDMTAIILTSSHRIEQIVINSNKSFSSFRVFPNPILKGLFYHFLLTLSNSSFFFIENRFLISVFIFHIVKDTNILKIKGIFNNSITIDSTCTVGGISNNIGSVISLIYDSPFTRKLGIFNFNIPLSITRCL